MCDVVGKVLSQVPETSRRRLLQGFTTAAVAGGLGVSGPSAATAGPPSPRSAGSQGAGKGNRTKLLLLGTAGGPTVLTDDRYGVSTAVLYDDKIYIVDLGHGSHMRFLSAGFGGGEFGGTSMAKIRGIFFTHLHSDHVVEWPAVYATASMNTVARTIPEPIQVFGPGDRGSLARVFPPNRPVPPVYNPADPTPGTVGMTGYLRQAFGTDFNDRARDSNFTSPDDLFDVHDIDLAGIWAPGPEGIPPRLTAPIQVWHDGDVTITATLVDHRPTAPAFGYRFDTPDGSVVVSGDTGVSQNLIDLARDCDYLVHEVIDPQFAADLAAVLPPAIAASVKEHLLISHTTVEQVGRDVAEPAGAKNLVLSHLVPGNAPVSRWRDAQKGYSGKLIVGEDLMQLGVGSKQK